MKRWKKTRRQKRRKALGTGRTPNENEIIRDPKWSPSGIKGQGGGAFG